MAATLRNFMGSGAALPASDTVITSEEKIKKQKKNVTHLYKQLKTFTEAYRKFLASRRAFFAELDELYESEWSEKEDFSDSLQELVNISENGARHLETIPMEETIVFMDQFGPFEKEIKNYKDKARQCAAADKKVLLHRKKKNANSDELRKLQNLAYEKRTSLGILQRKLREELPKFYNSRMDFYTKLWRSVFQIHGDISKAECETFAKLQASVRAFDQKRANGMYDSVDIDIPGPLPLDAADDDYYTVEGDAADLQRCSLLRAPAAGGRRRNNCDSLAEEDRTTASRSSSESSCYAVVQKTPAKAPASPVEAPKRSQGPPPVPTKPRLAPENFELGD